MSRKSKRPKMSLNPCPNSRRNPFNLIWEAWLYQNPWVNQLIFTDNPIETELLISIQDECGILVHTSDPHNLSRMALIMTDKVEYVIFTFENESKVGQEKWQQLAPAPKWKRFNHGFQREALEIKNYYVLK